MHRGCAGGSDDVVTDSPLRVIARPLYVHRPGDQPQLETIAAWQLPFTPRNDDDPALTLAPFEHSVAGGSDEWERSAFRKMLSQNAEFVIGNHRIFSEFGVVAHWLRDQDRRAEARDLIDQRQGWNVLDPLRHKENQPKDIIGVRDISAYCNSLPDPIDRPENRNEPKLSEKDQRLQSTLKLRKAIELLHILEALMRYRFSQNQSKDRFARITGERADAADAVRIWDLVWLEPIIYTVWPRPRASEIPKIVSHARTGDFGKKSGQKSDILYRILSGAPCSWRTAEAAAALCNEFYKTDPLNYDGKGPNPTYPVTIRPEDYAARLRMATTDALLPKEVQLPVRIRDKYFEDFSVLNGPIAGEMGITAPAPTVVGQSAGG